MQREGMPFIRGERELGYEPPELPNSAPILPQLDGKSVDYLDNADKANLKLQEGNLEKFEGKRRLRKKGVELKKATKGK